MFFVSLYRASKFAFQNFFRNIWLSVVTVVILTLALILISLIFGVGVVADQALDAVKERVDVSVFFIPEATEAKVQEIQEKLVNLPEVKSVDYISREEALAELKEKNKDNPVILETLEALGENPLGATLVIKANELDSYPDILKIFDDPDYKDLIQDKDSDFIATQEVINRLSQITNNIRRVGLIISIIFGVIAILVIFNTIRITIHSYGEEIGIMKLVGATNSFIRAPFVIESVIYAILASIITILVLWPIVNFIAPYLNQFFEGYNLDIVRYFTTNILQIIGFQLVVAVLLSIISSAVATGRYLKV